MGKVCNMTRKGGGCKSICIVFEDTLEDYYLNCGDDNECICMSKLTSLYTLIMCNFLVYQL